MYKLQVLVNLLKTLLFYAKKRKGHYKNNVKNKTSYIVKYIPLISTTFKF